MVDSHAFYKLELSRLNLKGMRPVQMLRGVYVSSAIALRRNLRKAFRNISLLLAVPGDFFCLF